MICGNTGCGRYDSAHAYKHYEETSHCYAMDITSQHVWDYAGDGYVHRLIQNKDATTNSRLIDLPGAVKHPNSAYRAESEDNVPREKMESMANEYTYLLTSQLDSQRRYFEEQLERAVDKASSACNRAETAAKSANEATSKAQASSAQFEEQQKTILLLEKNLEKVTLRSQRFEKMARDMSNQAREEKSMNDGLLARIKAAEEASRARDEEVSKLREEKAELQDLNRDLSIFIESREKVQELQAQGEEVEMGSSGVVESKKSGKGKGKGRKK